MAQLRAPREPLPNAVVAEIGTIEPAEPQRVKAHRWIKAREHPLEIPLVERIHPVQHQRVARRTRPRTRSHPPLSRGWRAEPRASAPARNVQRIRFNHGLLTQTSDLRSVQEETPRLSKPTRWPRAKAMRPTCDRELVPLSKSQPPNAVNNHESGIPVPPNLARRNANATDNRFAVAVTYRRDPDYRARRRLRSLCPRGVVSGRCARTAALPPMTLPARSSCARCARGASCSALGRGRRGQSHHRVMGAAGLLAVRWSV